MITPAVPGVPWLPGLIETGQAFPGFLTQAFALRGPREQSISPSHETTAFRRVQGDHTDQWPNVDGRFPNGLLEDPLLRKPVLALNEE